MTFFYIHKTIDSILFDFLVIFIFWGNFFSSILHHSIQNRHVLWKTQMIIFGYHFLLCNKYGVYVLIKKIDKILIHFGDALCKK